MSSNLTVQVNTTFLHSCRRPLAQPRDSTMREECAAFRGTKSTGEGGKRSVCIEHQNGFHELLTKHKSDLVWPCPDVPWMNLTV